MRTLGTSSTSACAGNDSRLSDARTPTSHASSHNAGGGDAMAIDAASGTGSLRTLGTSSTSACAGNDSRLSNDRTASGLRSATTVVSVSAATAPTTGQVLKATSSTTATWQTLSGTGDVVGPGSATDNAVARFDSTTGKLIQNSVVTIADSTGNISGAGTINGVDITSHASRHNPGGADAVTTASPSNIGSSNSEGTATSLARSDHVHGVPTGTCYMRLPIMEGNQTAGVDRYDNQYMCAMRYNDGAYAYLSYEIKPPQNYISGDITVNWYVTFGTANGAGRNVYCASYYAFRSAGDALGTYGGTTFATKSVASLAANTIKSFSFTIPEADVDVSKKILFMALIRAGDNVLDNVNKNMFAHRFELVYNGYKTADFM